MDQKLSSIWDKQQQNWIKEILSKSGTELKEISDKNGIKIIKKSRNLNKNSENFKKNCQKMVNKLNNYVKKLVTIN